MSEPNQAQIGGYRLGIDLGGTKIAGVLLDDKGGIVARHQVPTPQGDYSGTVAAVVGLVAWLQAQVEPVLDSCPIGIGTPGVHLPSSGLMANCNSTCLNDRPLLADLCQQLGPRISMANDADCFALSEWHHGVDVAPGQTLLGIILGTGVGAGIVNDGRLLSGPNALAGEWGHTPLPYFQVASSAQASVDTLELKLEPRLCYCGRVNCIETFLSGPGLSVMHEELWQEQRSPQALSAQWTADGLASGSADPALLRSRATLSLFLDMLARSLAQVINILDPQAIVVGGGLSSMDCLYRELPQRIPRYLFARQACATEILPPKGGSASGVFGAAWLG